MAQYLNVVLVVVAFAFGMAGCASQSARPVHWGYEGEKGPAAWGSLTPVYAVCGNGTMQSPIDIPAKAVPGTTSLKVEYGTTVLDIAHHEHVEEIINNGHTIQVSVDGDHAIELNGKKYALKQFHFHTSSEHLVGGKSFPMEMHLVHQSDDGMFAVVGVLFTTKAGESSVFDKVIPYLPSKPGDKQTFDNVFIDLDQLLPKERTGYHYVGSLTTPPCTENVQWLVLDHQKTVDPAVVTAIADRIKSNHRPPQALNGRVPTLDVTK